jgi:cob(I)alamin adenosyltransferase
LVRLTRIYTRAGDAGRTALGDGKRVSKTDLRIVAYGSVDELNAILGAVVGQRGLARGDRPLLRRIQNDLFDVGADLCVPRRKGERAGQRLRVTADQVETLGRAIDTRNAKLEPLASFVLPGGTPAAAWLHVARVVCRRAEVEVVRLSETRRAAVSEHVLPYLNRLSDLLFVMARTANKRGRADVLWQPGAGQASQDASSRRSSTSKHSSGSKRSSGKREGRLG